MHDSKTKAFVSYDYLEITVPEKNASLILDGYQNFGWFPDDHFMMQGKNKGRKKTVRLPLKRSRSLMNKMELTRLQHNFEACLDELEVLEKRRFSRAMICSLSTALIGTVFMTGSVFAVTHEPPLAGLCAILAVPAFAGWLLAYPVYQQVLRKQKRLLDPLIEQKKEELFQVCEKGAALL